MNIQATTRQGRAGWQLDNGIVSVFMMAGGGHIADVRHSARPKVNPLWAPLWKTIEPWRYQREDARRYQCRLLSAISGHNLCLGYFGDPSPAEAAAGLECHGEAPIARWQVISRQIGKSALVFEYGCQLPVAQLAVSRTLTIAGGASVIRVRERLVNRARRDQIFTMCQHVTLGPPFLEPSVTVFDMPATRGQTFPGPFGKPQRLKSSAAFTWPGAPGMKGKVDLRFMGQARNSDFTANLIDPRVKDAWFSAVNPRQGLLLAYIWHRSDYPWVGIWEENRARKTAPWNGRSLTRGLEFANTPFPIGLRKAVDLGRFQGEPAFRWIPAQSSMIFDYAILIMPVDADCRGVAAITPAGAGFKTDLIM